MRVPLLVSGNPNVLVFYYTGNGSASFDPSITTSANVNVYWKPDDALETVTFGTTHNFSYTPSSGYHRCTMRVNGGLGLVTAIDCNADSITIARNLGKCPFTQIRLHNNASLDLDCDIFAGKSIYYFSVIGNSKCYGNVSVIPRTAVNIYLSSTAYTGPLSDLPAVAQNVYAYLATGITPGSIAHLTAIRDIRIYSMWSSLSAAESVDIVIDSMWDARDDYTYATPSLQIGGTNPAPTGNYIAPEEGADWHNDGSKWIPLTPNAKAYDLVNDVNDEGFNTWTITTS